MVMETTTLCPLLLYTISVSPGPVPGAERGEAIRQTRVASVPGPQRIAHTLSPFMAHKAPVASNSK